MTPSENQEEAMLVNRRAGPILTAVLLVVQPGAGPEA